MLKKKSFLPLTLLLVTVLVEANATAVATNNGWTPESGRVLLSGTATSIGIFGGDGMLPVYGNKDGFLYGDFMGDYGTDDTYLVSPGGGFRQVLGNQIVGAYFFGDYERTSLGTNFWNLSPGIEWMSTHWDAHANGYFPTTTSQQSGSEGFASDFGDTSYVSFETGTNNQYDELVTPYAVIGNGVDAAIGYSFAGKDNLRSRIYLGGYYYAPPSSDDVENITGVTAGFEQPISENIAFAIRNSYDQVSQYTVGVSLIVTFGGESNLFSNNVRDRFLDPVQRHVGIIGTGSGTYDQQSLQDQGMALQYDNVYFVSDDGTGNGTYGSSAPLTQETLDMINDDTSNSRIYVQGGSDAVYDVNSDTATSALGLELYDGQSILGRSEDFTSAAAADEQPQIMVDTAHNYSGFIVQEGNNTISDVTLMGSSSGDGSGIVVYGAYDNAEDVTLNVINTQVTGFSYGASVENDGPGTVTLNASHSTFNDNLNAGIAVFNSTNVGDLNVNVTNVQMNGNISGMQIDSANSTGALTVTAVNSTFNNNTESGLTARTSNDTGGSVTITTVNSQLNNNGGSGLRLNNVGGEGNSSITLNLVNSTFNDNSADGITVGRAGGDATVTVNSVNSTFNNNARNGVSFYSFSGTENMTLNAVGSAFNNNGNSGIVAQNITETNMAISATNSQFYNNTNYGILGEATEMGTTSINYIGSTFSGDTQVATNQTEGDNIHWIP